MKNKCSILNSTQKLKTVVFDLKTHFSILIEISNIFT